MKTPAFFASLLLTLLLAACVTTSNIVSAKLTYTPEVRKQSSADNTLFKDLITQIGGVAFADEVHNPNVTQRTLASITVLKPYDNKSLGTEIWRVTHDNGSSTDYRVLLLPNGRGGTTFDVKKEEPQ